jgi:hypothetical protein
MKKVLVTISILALSHGAFALEKMNDQDLASQTGQDGITIKLGVSTVSFNQLSLIDTNGMTGAAGSAALVIAPTTSGDIAKVNFLNAGGTAVSNLVTATIDSDGGATSGDPFANINLTFSDLKTITMDPFAIYLAPTLNGSRTIGSVGSMFGSGATLRAGVSKLMEIGSGNEKLTVNFKDALGLNIQLGNAPQKQMIAFSGSLQNINIPKIKLFSKNAGTNTSSLGLDVELKATNASGISLNGFYLDVTTGGINFGKVGTTDKFDVTLSNVIAGTKNSQSVDNFANLKNGSMGNFGMVGASVTNLKVNVRGL